MPASPRSSPERPHWGFLNVSAPPDKNPAIGRKAFCLRSKASIPRPPRFFPAWCPPEAFSPGAAGLFLTHGSGQCQWPPPRKPGLHTRRRSHSTWRAAGRCGPAPPPARPRRKIPWKPGRPRAPSWWHNNGRNPSPPGAWTDRTATVRESESSLPKADPCRSSS